MGCAVLLCIAPSTCLVAQVSLRPVGSQSWFAVRPTSHVCAPSRAASVEAPSTSVASKMVIVQGAGVAESAPNPDGSPPYTNGDFIGQGVANLAAGLFNGIPVGGSVSSTASTYQAFWAAVPPLVLTPVRSGT